MAGGGVGLFVLIRQVEGGAWEWAFLIWQAEAPLADEWRELAARTPTDGGRLALGTLAVCVGIEVCRRALRLGTLAGAWPVGVGAAGAHAGVVLRALAGGR